jgi:hypothetical protein
LVFELAASLRNSVCFLRLGDPNAAVEVLRGLVIAGHLNLKCDTPLVFQTNFATALLLKGNITGGEGILNDIRNEQHPSVQRLREPIRRRKAGMTFRQRISWRLGGEPTERQRLEPASSHYRSKASPQQALCARWVFSLRLLRARGGSPATKLCGSVA